MKKPMSYIFWGAILFIAGFFSAWVYAKVTSVFSDGPLASIPYFEYVDVNPDLESAFRSTLLDFKKANKLTPLQMGELFRRSGFAGFRDSTFKKGARVEGLEYFTSTTGKVNRIWWSKNPSNAIDLGPRNLVTGVILNRNPPSVKAVAVFDESSSEDDIDFLIFTPAYIYQFTLDSVWGRRYKRQPE